MKSYFKPLFLIGDGGDGELIPPGQLGSVISEGGGATDGGRNANVFAPQSADVFTDAAPAPAEAYVPSEFTPPIDQAQG